MITSKRFFLLALFLVSLLLLPASAQSAVPPFSSTSEYKEINEYITMLQGMSETPTPESVITEYQTQFAALIAAGQTKIDSLHQRRLQRIKNQVSANRKKGVRKVRKQEKGKLRKAKKTRKKQIAQSSRQYQRIVNKINARYQGKINSLQKKIANLKRKEQQTRNPRKLALLADRIEKAQTLLQNNVEDRQSALNAASLALSQEVKSVKRQYKSRSKKIRRNADRKVNRVVAKYKNRSAERRQQAKAVKENEQAQLAEQNAAGQTAISNIPVAPE